MERTHQRNVTFVVTLGSSSLDYYAQKLAEHLPVPKLYTDVYGRSREVFNVPLASAAAARAAWGDAAFVRRLRVTDGVIHLPNHHLARYGPFVSRPYVVTVHDLIRQFDARGREPLIHAPNRRDRLLLRLDAAGIRKAPMVIAVSETTKRDLVRHLDIPESRITVVYEGVDHRQFRPVERRLHEQPYILFVGSEHPRKNLATLLEAFARLKREPRFQDLTLVKVGEAGGREAPFRERTLRAVSEFGLERDVMFAGPVEADDLAAYYSGAECLVLPSLYEGFGLPPVEAMACGCPVVVARAGALPEIGGDAAVVVPPRGAEALAAAMREILTDARLRSDLAARGIARAGEFSWERAARETLAVYERIG
jgi:glycosyltransferase involved in cell wall biosynthesis